MVTPETLDASLQQSLPTVYERLGDAYALVATKHAATRLANWRAACEWYRKSLNAWLDLQKRNLLKDAEGKPNELSQKLTKCEAALEPLKTK